MSLLTALLAVVPALRPKSEPEVSAQALEALANGQRVLEVSNEMRKAAQRRVAELEAENAGLRHHLDLLMGERDRYAYQQGNLLAQQTYQQNNPSPFNAQQMLGMRNSDWACCTCVPGRYDALRDARVFHGT